ncbi:GTPase HflX [Gottfriedia luciferensis]|uniref:GTPase HflX n=1 Tax=Gottfriedia luciferensis TaxID=178774 RepID=UPI000B43AA20|nr:GTPase HflX [Gottfriedia luciferensis]
MSNELREKAILVGCQLQNVDDDRFHYSMEELASLTKTANGEVVLITSQKRTKYHSALYIGTGKVEELEAAIAELEPDVVIFNNELTPSQIRNLSARLEKRVIDRTQLILDIFAQRAKTKEGKLQVELAQLQYLMPRLVGQGTELSRLGGGIGTRGPGETKLESDRRHIRKRIDDIKLQLKVIVEHRKRYRERRKKNEMFHISLVGYTNAGKSTLFNRLTKSDVYEQDLLFATLDPTTRKFVLSNGMTTLLTDTVGFIQDLPTSLIAAFRSTLEEATEADFILHVVDASHENYRSHEVTVSKLLNDLDVENIPILTVYNKIDQVHENFVPSPSEGFIEMSALNEADLLKLRQRIEFDCKQYMEYFEAFVPAYEGKMIHDIKKLTMVESIHFNEETEIYQITGYVFKEHSIYDTVKRYRRNKEQ